LAKKTLAATSAAPMVFTDNFIGGFLLFQGSTGTALPQLRPMNFAPKLFRGVVTRSCSYQPMLEVLRYLRDNACRIYIVTDGGQGFVRVFDDAFGPEVGAV
jgi:hypothetical protein